MKNYSRGAKRRAKQALPELAKTPRRKARGKSRMREIERENEAENTSVAYGARQRQTGCKDSEVTIAALSEPPGQAIYAVKGGSDANELWATYTAYRDATRRYYAQRVGQLPEPKLMRLDMVPEKFEVSGADTLDVRSDDERHRAAVNRFQEWQGHLSKLTDAQADILKRSLFATSELYTMRQVTHAGRRFVACLVELHKIVGKHT